MQERRNIVVIGKQRPYDEERWKQLILALAYGLHELRKAREEEAQTNGNGGGNQ